MIQVYKHSNGHLEDNISLASAEKGSWIHVVNPDSEDLQLVSMVTEIPTDVLKTALDTEERSHVEIEDNYIFVVINIPIILETDSYDTLPLGIFITPDFIITLCIQETEVMRAFTENKYPLFYTFKKTRFLFQILYRSATLFLRYLMQINRRTDDIEEILRHSMRNKEFFLLLELQKSLTYFTSALRSNGTSWNGSCACAAIRRSTTSSRCMKKTKTSWKMSSSKTSRLSKWSRCIPTSS